VARRGRGRVGEGRRGSGGCSGVIIRRWRRNTWQRACWVMHTTAGVMNWSQLTAWQVPCPRKRTPTASGTPFNATRVSL